MAKGVVYFGCRDSHLYALDAATGKQRWSLSNDGAWVIASPAVDGNNVYYANADGRSFYRVNAITGKAVDSLKASWYFFASPAIAGAMAYVANWDGRLTAVDLTTFAPAWVFQTDSSRANLEKYVNPDGSMSFRRTNQRAEYFYDGLQVALYRTFTMGSFLSSPVVAGGVVYIGSTDGNLYAIGAH